MAVFSEPVLPNLEYLEANQFLDLSMSFLDDLVVHVLLLLPDLIVSLE